MDRKSVLVLQVHEWWTQTAQRNYLNDYNFIRWKYAAVLATTGGLFGSVTISPNSLVPCGLLGKLVTVCTHHPSDNVDFGTSAFTQTENATASTIGHELVHTTGVILPASECTAYSWELTNSQSTGIFQCDAGYFSDVIQNQVNECNCCP